MFEEACAAISDRDLDKVEDIYLRRKA